MQRAFRFLGYKRHGADPCLYFRWIKGKLIEWLVWIDDCLILGEKDTVIEAKESMKELDDYDDVGEM